jgi:hypothetical protein
MKKMKKVLAMIMVIAIMFGGMVFGATESAQVIITTEVGETTANSGIKVVESYTGTTPTAFDATFFSAGSVITLATGKDTSIEDATGNFVVMVRRPVNTTISVTITGSTMALTGATVTAPTIPYKILGTETPYPTTYINYVSSTPVITNTYTTTGAVDGILRDAKKFTYIIPKSASAPLGTYSATITFKIDIT